ncbi:exported hypothetical protein [Verrucomicrobia bacterium]|nr:exported hypothetical protein [Verrucomicrobiota bacterium]
MRAALKTTRRLRAPTLTSLVFGAARLPALTDSLIHPSPLSHHPFAAPPATLASFSSIGFLEPLRQPPRAESP